MSEIIQIISDIFSIISYVFSIYCGKFFTTQKNKIFFFESPAQDKIFSLLFSIGPFFILKHTKKYRHAVNAA